MRVRRKLVGWLVFCTHGIICVVEFRCSKMFLVKLGLKQLWSIWYIGIRCWAGLGHCMGLLRKICRRETMLNLSITNHVFKSAMATSLHTTPQSRTPHRRSSRRGRRTQVPEASAALPAPSPWHVVRGSTESDRRRSTNHLRRPHREAALRPTHEPRYSRDTVEI